MGYHFFNPISQKLYMSRHVVFLEHIPFFSIPSTTHCLTRYDLIHIDLFPRILVVYPLRFLVPQILLLMFDHFILIILQVLILYSTTHLKLHSPLRPLKICLRLWIHLCVNPYAFIHLQSYKIFLILVILHHLLFFSFYSLSL